MTLTYSIFKLLTEDEVEGMLNPPSPYIVSPHGLLRTEIEWYCPFGMALGHCFRPSPEPTLIARGLLGRDESLTEDDLIQMAFAFTNAADSGEIKPEDLAEIVRLSREVC